MNTKVNGQTRTDIIQMRQRIAELEQANTRLEQINLDLTQQLTEQKTILRESQSLLHAVLDNSTAAIYVKDLQGRFLIMNQRAALEMYLKRKQRREKRTKGTSPLEMTEQWNLHEQQVLTTGKPVETEEIFHYPDGPRTLLTIKFPFYNDQGTIYAVGSIATDITERKQAEEAAQAALKLTEARAAELQGLNRVAAALNQSISPQSALQKGLEAVAHLINAPTGWLWVVSEHGIVNLVASYQSPLQQHDNDETEPYWHHCDCIHQLLNNQLTRPVHLIPCQRLNSTQQPTATAFHATIPIQVSGKPIGILNLILSNERHFDATEMRIFAAVSNQFGIAIERWRLFAQTTDALQREQRLNEVTRTISSALNLNRVLPTIVRLAIELVGADAGGMGLVSPETNQVIFPYFCNFPAAEELLSNRQNLTSINILEHVLTTGESICLNEYPHHPHAIPELVRAGLHGIIGIPIIAGEERLGMLGLYNLTDHKHFTRRDLILSESVGRQAGIAIQNARLFEAERMRVQELHALRATMNEILGELELAKLLNDILERAVALSRATAGELSLYDSEHNNLQIVASHNMAQNNAGTSLALGEGIMGRAAQNRQPLIIHNNHTSSLSASLPHTILAIPLIAGDDLVGAISISDTNTNRHYDTRDVEHLNLLAQSATIAIQNARLFAAVQKSAITDPLTGLYNRRHFFELAYREFDRTLRSSHSLTAIMMDIDHFKQINDIYGHATGDQVLRALADHCRTTLRAGDLIGRYGGEEFAIILPETDLENAQSVAERLRNHLAQTAIPIDNGVLYITASLGIAAIDRRNTSINLDKLLDRADQALLAAKQAGRNRVVSWDATWKGPPYPITHNPR